MNLLEENRKYYQTQLGKDFLDRIKNHRQKIKIRQMVLYQTKKNLQSFCTARGKQGRDNQLNRKIYLHLYT
jgi:hypothetical protein